MRAVADRLAAVYPDAACALKWDDDPWKLLIMGCLSAQCTDARVNLTAKELFSLYPTPGDMADADLAELEAILRPCGLFRTKAKNAKESSRMLVETFDGRLPDNMEELLTLPGVGRKVANLCLGDVYHTGSFVTDTHCIRICGRLGFYPESEKNPAKIERLLDPLLPRAEQSDFCHRIVNFGRDTCQARAPKCDICPLADLCEHRKKNS
ncbi:MAG: endonuclease III [Clostridia bacterium]|nr:endonuclease III [Clostridia bacterium]